MRIARNITELIGRTPSSAIEPHSRTEGCVAQIVGETGKFEPICLS